MPVNKSKGRTLITDDNPIDVFVWTGSYQLIDV